MANDIVSDELWEEFHRVVNMTSRELREWLQVRSATEDAQVPLDKAGTDTGQSVAHILSKRRTDITEKDVAVMEKVVGTIHEERREDLEPTAGQAAWRHKLMTMGHDPLKPAD
jgi:DNA topoisomerase VI subunit B